jgi:hypothetical protein
MFFPSRTVRYLTDLNPHEDFDQSAYDIATDQQQLAGGRRQ